MKRTRDIDDLEQPLREVLAHFYDSSYEVPEEVLEHFQLSPRDNSEVWRYLNQTIESLKPTPETPLSSHSWRLYNILVCRYSKGLTQEQTAEHLSISPRHLRREQQLAVRVLARRLLEQPFLEQPFEKLEQPSQVLENPSWRLQVKQELASLQKKSPGAMSEVREVIRKAAERSQVLTSKQNIAVSLESVQNLTVTLHPSVLQQVIVEMIESFITSSVQDTIVFQTEQQGQHVFITARGVVGDDKSSLAISDFIEEMLKLEGGSVTSSSKGNRVVITLKLPTASKLTVLVVDDNQDLIHFYKRYTSNTKYHIHHLSEGYDLLERALQLSPAIILLDVMLPDTDGWELLTRLREHPATRSTPVIVCSVIKDEDLALALGASQFLAKPVSRQQFLEALGQVSSRLS
jgi:CheY-like chemotaxis protein